MHVVALEFFKLRRRRVLLMIVLFLGVEILWASISVSNSFTRNPDSAGWEGIITTFSSMNGLFLPILSASWYPASSTWNTRGRRGGCSGPWP